MPNRTNVTFATCNLYNMNLPGLPVYTDTDGWDQAAYDRKVAWTARMLGEVGADVWGFEELWHGQALTDIFTSAGLDGDYALLVPPGHAGQSIVCGGAVRKSILVGEPQWIAGFPEKFRLHSSGDDEQTSEIEVGIHTFSRPVLHFQVRPRSDGKVISVYVAHLKSKAPAKIYTEAWYKADKSYYSKHSEALGSAVSTIRRTAEAAALRMILTEQMKGNDLPVVVLGDLNDSQQSNTLNIILKTSIWQVRSGGKSGRLWLLAAFGEAPDG